MTKTFIKLRITDLGVQFLLRTGMVLAGVLPGMVSVFAQSDPGSASSRYAITEGTVSFVSDAPLERIAATSHDLKGLVEAGNGTFAFTLDISSFQGFNSPLQRVHFNENYMETNTYPTASFAGKFIEDIDLSADGTHEVRVKGKLKVHGVEKERIIKAKVEIENGQMRIHSTFTILLEDHNIRIPRVVHQKIAQVVNVEVSAILSTNKS